MSELLVKLTTLSGPARPWMLRRGSSLVVAVPCRYCVTYVLVCGRDAVVVDVGSAADVPRILGVLDRCGLAGAQVRYVLPTHLHFDHVMGLDSLARVLGVPVALAEPAWEHVLHGAPLRFASLSRMKRPLGTWPMQGLPFLPLDDWRRGLDFGTPWGRNRFTAPLGPRLQHGEPLPELAPWMVLSTPGHADDEICLYHAELGVIVAGDVVRNFYGGEWNPFVVDPRDMARSRALLEPLEVRAVLPGHGPVIGGLRSMSELLTVPGYLP